MNNNWSNPAVGGGPLQQQQIEQTRAVSLETLVDTRNKKLVELYCVSKLGELLDIVDEAKFQNDLDEFLAKNDIVKKGLRFHASSLPAQPHNLSHHVGPSLNLSNSAPHLQTGRQAAGGRNSLINSKKRSISTSSISNISKRESGSQSKNGGGKGSAGSTATRHSISIMGRPKSGTPQVSMVSPSESVDIGTGKSGDQFISVDVAGVPKQSFQEPVETAEMSQTTDVKARSQPASGTRKRELGSDSTGVKDSAEEPVAKRAKVHFDDSQYNSYHAEHRSADTEDDASRPARAMTQHIPYYVDPNLPTPKATPIETSHRSKNELVNRIHNQRDVKTSGFVPNNVNSKESILLLMKDIIPSKVAQGIPLAELRYMSQTLPLINLIPRAHKILTTDIINNALNEARITVVSSRIEELRRLGLWSLRQPKKFVDPFNNGDTHHSVLLNEAKWMADDFKEGKKYKMAVCITMAQAVADYWTYGKEHSCVETREPRFLSQEEQETANNPVDTDQEHPVGSDSELKPAAIIDAEDEAAQSNTESHTQGSPDSQGEVAADVESEIPSPVTTVASIDTKLLLKEPSEAAPMTTESLGSLVKDSTLNPAPSPQRNPAGPFKLTLSFDELNDNERAIAEDIPLYVGVKEEAGILGETQNEKPDVLPFALISKSMTTLEDDHFYKLIERQVIDDEQSLVQLSKRRGMFYGNRRSHYLRPPSVPSLRYLQNRTPTIWLPEDDQELVKNINNYAYNWELISANMVHMPSRSYLSNIERRTPWQCFERFVQLNERFNFNDLKGPRAHRAQMWLIEAHKFQQRQNRRISPLGVGAESIQRGHRRLRWASMFEVMRRCIKKRENMPRPNPTQSRKPLDCKNMKVPTPAEMSQLKAQRDEALRRDMQLRRTAKSRLQQKQTQAAQQAQQIKGAARAQTVPNPVKVEPTPQSLPPQRKLTEREIVESYSRKILLQKPNLSPELALKAAESYYKQIKEQQIHQARAEIIQRSGAQIVPGLPGHPVPNSMTANGTDVNKIKSPTPSEILQRYQK
ncbi:Eaf1p KNAG_0C05030 [Huiozyma naganishii CBS 8797]|uniref:Chromatin modification-related protein EAF1 n=1 Tax=Huiozyma naganishii (strain ATCC MYA-139 / BCRC 22969 / CBS 8797 / KCTC 17520 / NBRC 10181 / NCYC 3082 / Yp74L-3) TaxID=1071383 RepID=J7S513_HUIN7|nr:hypothetical protein KNAG_0C05030 [Kazachstania naganishii CBS 8797]CCK69604.1 hypothetical protein KNAG_0C05030 [Kazachstania naganishii CBS 8797]